MLVRSSHYKDGLHTLSKKLFQKIFAINGATGCTYSVAELANVHEKTLLHVVITSRNVLLVFMIRDLCDILGYLDLSDGIKLWPILQLVQPMSRVRSQIRRVTSFSTISGKKRKETCLVSITPNSFRHQLVFRFTSIKFVSDSIDSALVRGFIEKFDGEMRNRILTDDEESKIVKYFNKNGKRVTIDAVKLTFYHTMRYASQTYRSQSFKYVEHEIFIFEFECFVYYFIISCLIALLFTSIFVFLVRL
jgi:hypothetical protein